MSIHHITSRLHRLALWYDYTIICKDFKGAIVASEKNEDGTERCTWGIKLINPVEYTQKEIFDKYKDVKVLKWVHTYTESGEPAMAVVLKGE